MSESIFFEKGLYLVATPIGNLGDLSPRAVAVLKNADVVACEDTRITGKLLSLNAISTPMMNYHEHNADKMRPVLTARLKKGETVALVSDAGTPLVSDPGHKLVADCIKEGIYVTAVPGASALLTALQLSGLPTRRFLFQGFLPPKSSARKTTLAELKNVPSTLIFYEAPQRMIETLTDMKEVLGDRACSVSRELTKKFEQTVRGKISDILDLYAQDGVPKGEFVVVVAPPLEEKAGERDVEAALKQALETMSVKDAAAFVAQALNANKKEVYTLALKLKNG